MSAAISSLPNELLVAIAAAGQEGRIPDLDTPFDSRLEWTLSHLCRRFRNVVVGAPALWTFIEVNLCVEGSIEISKLYLDRSRTCHISATLKYPRRNIFSQMASASNSIAEQLIRILSHIDRMWRLNLQLRTELGGPSLNSFHRSLSAPNLQYLEIATETIARAPMFSLEAPRLTFAKIIGFNALLVSVWTTSLTHLELRTVEEEDDRVFVAIAEQCALLVHLRIDMTCCPLRHRFHLPVLKYLHITINYNAAEPALMSDIVELLDTPLLAEFTINDAHGDGVFALFNATNARTSFPALTSLCFIRRHSCDSADEDISHSISSPPLGRFPALESLTFINICFTRNLAQEILGCPWPLLRTITMCPNYDAPDVCFALREASRLKRQRGLQLPKFRLSPDLFSLVEGWEEHIMDVEVFDPVEVIDSLC